MPINHSAIKDLPKAELHLHIEGTLEPELAFSFAQRNKVQLPFETAAELRDLYEFEDLKSFLDLYYLCMSVLRTEQDFFELAIAYLEKAHGQGVRHVEMFFDPQVHATNDIDVNVVIDGLSNALDVAKERWGMTGGLIMCFVRDLPVESAAALMESVSHRFQDLVGVGLDSAEVGFPPVLFKEVFEKAAKLNLHRVAHAGEEGPPSYIWEALDELKVERIDHGIRAIEDPELIQFLAEKEIPLTICPLSNVKLRAVHDLATHPLDKLASQGVKVTINSDDPAYFGGYVADNYQALLDVGYDLSTLSEFAANSIQASFADNSRKQELLKEIELWRTREL